MSTHQFIQNYLYRVINDFGKSEWCAMNNFELNTESYSLPVNQQRYILKYFAAYFCEYYYTYGKTLQRAIELKINSIDIMSIGCGCGVDLYALDRVIEDKFGSIPEVKYIGIDAIDWGYRTEKSSISFEFQNKFLADVSAEDISNINIFSFPKSLTELQLMGLASFGKLVAKHSKRDRIFFVNSYITNDPTDGSKVNGINQFRNVFDALISGGYSTQDDPNVYNYLTNDNAGLNTKFDFFNIPNEIVAVVKYLKKHCAEHIESHPQCQVCNIDFLPIMKSNYLAYRIFEFTRQ